MVVPPGVESETLTLPGTPCGIITYTCVLETVNIVAGFEEKITEFVPSRFIPFINRVLFIFPLVLFKLVIEGFL